jgi:hypothetical protein
MDLDLAEIGKLITEVENKKKERRRATPEQLTELATSYFEGHQLRRGDLVTWKPGLKSARLPDYGEPAVVLAVQPEQIDPTVDAKMPGYKEPADVRIGVMTEVEGGVGFCGWWTDGARLMPYRADAGDKIEATGNAAADIDAGLRREPPPRPDPDPIARFDRPAAHPVWPVRDN